MECSKHKGRKNFSSRIVQLSKISASQQGLFVDTATVFHLFLNAVVIIITRLQLFVGHCMTHELVTQNNVYLIFTTGYFSFLIK